MAAKVFFVLCAQAVFVQMALSQCTSPASVAAIPGPYGLPGLGLAGPALNAPGFAPGYLGSPVAYEGLAFPSRSMAYDGIVSPAIEFTGTTGGGLAVTSSSAIPPTGITVVSENAFEGVLSLVGEVPFVGTSGMEGVVPSAGSGVVSHAYGNGVTAMASDLVASAPAGIAAANFLAPAAGLGVNAYGSAVGLGSAAYGSGLAGFPNGYSSCNRGLVL